MLQALSLGAADVISSPLVKEEVQARYHRRVADSRAHAASRTEFSIADIRIIPALRQVACGFLTRQLAPVPFSLLEFLVKNYTRTLDRWELVSHAWKGRAVSANSLDQQIQHVRTTLGEVGSTLQVKSIYGIGFQLAAATQLDAPSHPKGKKSDRIR
jgi:DNA-binding response OmpR family regulator